jgi:hypothetical protein
MLDHLNLIATKARLLREVPEVVDEFRSVRRISELKYAGKYLEKSNGEIIPPDDRAMNAVREKLSFLTGEVDQLARLLAQHLPVTAKECTLIQLRTWSGPDFTRPGFDADEFRRQCHVVEVAAAHAALSAPDTTGGDAKADATTETAGWPTVSETAEDLTIDKSRIGDLVAKGKLRDNGKTGILRRIDPGSIVQYRQALRQSNKPPKQVIAKSKDDRSPPSGTRWRCKKAYCGWRGVVRTDQVDCPRCSGHIELEPLPKR